MNEVTIVGVDLAKSVFQLHGADDEGRTIFRKKLTRAQFARFMNKLPPCMVAMEACATSHYWGRQLQASGHEVKLIPPVYVKPFVKRQKNDPADAEAIVDAAQRPNMRSVKVKTAEQQARSMLFRTRELLVRRRTQMVNALRAHLAEHGYCAPKGIGHVTRLAEIIADPEVDLPDLVREVSQVYLDEISSATKQINDLQLKIAEQSAKSGIAQRLQAMPGIGPVCAMAIEAFAPDMTSFAKGRGFSAWLGLVPRQHSTGGKQRLGRTSKMGQRDIRRLLILGAMSVVNQAGRRKVGLPEGSWLRRMMERKPKMLVAIALANKMARMIWAMLSRNEEYRDPMAA